MEGVEDFGNWIDLCCEGVPVLLVNVFPGGGGLSLPSPSPVLPLVEGNPPVGLPVDNGSGVGRDFIERGCNVDAEFRDRLRVTGVAGGLFLPSLLLVLPLVEGDLDTEFRELRVMGARDG